MKIFKIFLATILLNIVYAKDINWHKLKPFNTYSPKSYNPKKNIEYMEIRGYINKKNHKVSNIISIYKKPLESYPKDIIKKFKVLKPIYSNKSNIRLSGNAFFIDSNGKIFQMDMREDIISLLGNIDRLSEVQLILWLHYQDDGKYYKKVSNGYKIKISKVLNKCSSLNWLAKVDKKGNYSEQDKFNLVRRGCKKRKNTKFIKNKRLNYEDYHLIVIDNHNNIYVVAHLKNNNIEILDKYNSSGKKIWSRKLRRVNSEKMAIIDNYIYIINYDKSTIKYSLNGKKQSYKKSNKIKIDNDIPKKKSYKIDGLPNRKEFIDIIVDNYVVDNKGYIYIIGMEIFYIGGMPERNLECGNIEMITGAVIAKLNSRGKTIWVKVIDRDK